MLIKSADDRQPDIRALEALLDQSALPSATRKRIQDEIVRIQAGERAEQQAAYYIELYFGRSSNWATIHDLRIDVDGLTAQIDHVILNRLSEIWVCESKSFADRVEVNEHGEWTRWWNGRPSGMPSPIEQNHRHVHLLQRAFDDGLVRRPRALGLVPMKPVIKSLVLVSDNAQIKRPRGKPKWLDEVIKADQLKTRLFDAFDSTPITNSWRLLGKEGLEAYARSLASLHRPANAEWASRFGVDSAPDAGQLADATTLGQTAPRASRGGSGHRCASCGASVSFAVVKFCWANKPRFEWRRLLHRMPAEVSTFGSP